MMIIVFQFVSVLFLLLQFLTANSHQFSSCMVHVYDLLFRSILEVSWVISLIKFLLVSCTLLFWIMVCFLFFFFFFISVHFFVAVSIIIITFQFYFQFLTILHQDFTQDLQWANVVTVCMYVCIYIFWWLFWVEFFSHIDNSLLKRRTVPQSEFFLYFI